MNDDACRGKREDIGAYVLGSLDENRTTALVAHLDGCPACRAQVEELAAVARLLPLADPLRSSHQPAPPARLGESIVRRIEVERRAARRRGVRRAGAVSLGMAAAIVALIAYLAITGPNVLNVDFPSQTGAAESHAGLEYLPGGTRITLAVGGLPAEESYGVWMEKQDGERVPAGSFYMPDDGELKLALTAAVRLKDCVAIGVSDSTGDTVLYARIK
jgi:predicted anti-sigma-YlaC factor YlaD